MTGLNETEAAVRHYAVFSARVRALVIDSFVLIGVLVAAMLALDLLPGDLFGRFFVVLMFAEILVYEPIMVSTLGGTVGHRLQNLRVLDQNTGQRIGFLRALLRLAIKTIAGILSFFFMAITRRHQALHDLASRSVVVVHDLERAETSDYVEELTGEQMLVAVSILRRIVVILVYWLMILAAVSVVPLPFVSEECMLTDVCTRAEDRIFTITGVLMMLGFGTSLVQGWRGKLPGARPRRVPFPESIAPAPAGMPHDANNPTIRD